VLDRFPQSCVFCRATPKYILPSTSPFSIHPTSSKHEHISTITENNATEKCYKYGISCHMKCHGNRHIFDPSPYASRYLAMTSSSAYSRPIDRVDRLCYLYRVTSTQNIGIEQAMMAVASSMVPKTKSSTVVARLLSRHIGWRG